MGEADADGLLGRGESCLKRYRRGIKDLGYEDEATAPFGGSG